MSRALPVLPLYPALRSVLNCVGLQIEEKCEWLQAQMEVCIVAVGSVGWVDVAWRRHRRGVEVLATMGRIIEEVLME